VWTVASCGPHTRDRPLASADPTREPQAAATSSAAARVPPRYFGDEYAKEQRALQDRPIEAAAPTF
jgi:hypothetical protein